MGNAKDALRNVALNTAGRWCYGDVQRDTDPKLAINRIGSGYFIPSFEPKFRIGNGAVFFSIGSCFAREIETALLRLGWDVPSRVKDAEGNPLFELKRGVTTIHDYFNRYNIPSIAAEVENISSKAGYSLGDLLTYEAGDGTYDDLHYTPAAESCTLEILLERRRWLWQRLAAGYARADVVVLTLGLSEAWFDTKAQRYLSVVSSPNMLRKYGDQLEIRFIGFTEAQTHLNSALTRLKEDGKKVILTVSPVPLQYTFLGEDVVIANSAAKSNLRALSVEAAQNYDNVDYFPSFEMVNYSEKSVAWKPDGRHVQMGMVETIMKKAIDSLIQDKQ